MDENFEREGIKCLILIIPVDVVVIVKIVWRRRRRRFGHFQFPQLQLGVYEYSLNGLRTAHQGREGGGGCAGPCGHGNLLLKCELIQRNDFFVIKN
jgi:hypothetical protein